MPQKLNTEEIGELLPDFSGTSTPSLLEAKEAWERILMETGVHRDLWGSIVLSKLKGKALLSLQHSVKRDCMFEEICEALDDIFGGTLKTNYNIVKSHLTAGEIPNSLENPYEVNEKSLDEHHGNNMGEAKHGDSSPHYKQKPDLADDERISQYISQRVRVSSRS